VRVVRRRSRQTAVRLSCFLFSMQRCHLAAVYPACQSAVTSQPLLPS